MSVVCEEFKTHFNSHDDPQDQTDFVSLSAISLQQIAIFIENQYQETQGLLELDFDE